MKAKTLLIAAAALAAATISSEAQVYSQNIVGYANVVTPAGAYAAVANPFDLDGENNVTNVLASVPNSTQVLIWNGAGYNTVTKSVVGKWPASAATTFIPPGVGFLIKTPTQTTNTFVGSIVPSVPGTNSMALSGGVYQFVSSTIPYAGDLNDTNLNLGPSLPKGSQVLVWNGAGYTTATKSIATGNWNVNPTIGVGQGVLVKPSTATNWVQSIQ